jgi:phospholipid/cholesterol/gamma-HCH transport system substrate-binding protein
VTVTAPRAGLVMERDAKVKYRGIQIGKVKNIVYADEQAQLTLAIDSSQLRYIPSNADVRIASNTIFGAKSVEFLPPRRPSGTPLKSGAHVAVSSVQLGQHVVPDIGRRAAQDRPDRAERRAVGDRRGFA